MSTTIYLESSGTPGTTPPYEAWNNTTYAARYPAGTTKTSTTLTSVRVYDALSTAQSLLVGQWITLPLQAGQTITGGQTMRVVIRASEYNSQSNLFIRWYVKIVNGTTTNKTMVSARTDTTEISTSLISRTDSVASAAGNYTTVAGDRLVIEIGVYGDPGGSNIHDGTLRIGSSSATNLTYVDGTASDYNPSVFLTDTLTFSNTLEVAASESVTLTESVTAFLENYVPAKQETVTITETVSCTVSTPQVSAQETITLTESTTPNERSYTSTSDSITVTTLPRFYPETIRVSDRATVYIIAAAPAIDVDENITVTENINVAVTSEFEVYSSETIGTSESVTLSGNTCPVSASENITTTESVTGMIVIGYINVHDHVTITESCDVTVSAPQVSIHDDVSITENASPGMRASRVNVYDLVAVSESNPTVYVVPSIMLYSVSVSDTVTLTDSYSLLCVPIDFIALTLVTRSTGFTLHTRDDGFTLVDRSVTLTLEDK